MELFVPPGMFFSFGRVRERHHRVREDLQLKSGGRDEESLIHGCRLPRYLSKALRGNLSDLPTMCSHETHEELLRDILQKPPRLNKEEAVRALRSAIPGADKAASSAFAASMVVCVQNIFAKRKSMTSGKKSSPSLVRLISLADELYPAERRDRMAEAAPAASAAAGSKAAALPVAGQAGS